jgi:drug/metabolite transporter (DMT)-like permease
MQRKDRLDAFGGSVLLGVTLLLAFNQVIVKLVNEGLQPVFFAGLRSAIEVFFVWAWLAYKGRPPRLSRATLPTGLLMVTVFAAEFLCLFMALDLTTVGRTSVIFYSMPVWFAIMAHYGLGERLTSTRIAGLTLAFAGAAWAILSGSSSGEGSLAGDLFALGGALGWAGTAYIARRPVMRAEGPEMQLFWMVPRLWSDPSALCALLWTPHPRASAAAHRLASVPVLGRGGGGLHHLALAPFGLSGTDGRVVFLPDADPRHRAWCPDFRRNGHLGDSCRSRTCGHRHRSHQPPDHAARLAAAQKNRTRICPQPRTVSEAGLPNRPLDWQITDSSQVTRRLSPNLSTAVDHKS